MSARRKTKRSVSEPLEVRLCLSGANFLDIDDFSSLGLSTQGAMLGTSVSVGDRFAVLGAPDGLGLQERSGRVAVFEHDDAGTSADGSDDFWQLHSEIPSPIDLAGQGFGTAVAIHGETIFVGAPGNILGDDAGRVFTFALEQGEWVHTQTISGPTAGTSETFGSSLSVNEHTLVVGSPFAEASGLRAGVVDVFQQGANAWEHSWRLFGESSDVGDAFGTAVSLDGNRLAVGAPGDDFGVADSGRVEIFEVSDGAWSRVDVLRTASPGFRDRLGTSVSLDVGTIAAGAPGRAVAEVTAAGSAMTFAAAGDGWSETAIVVPETPTAEAGFGAAVSLANGRLLIGAPNESAGAAYGYTAVDDGWLAEPPLVPGGRKGDRFGAAIAQNEYFAIVGVPSFDVVAAQTGSGKSYFRGAADAWQATPDSRLRAASEFGQFEANYDGAGRSVAISDDYVVVGIPDRDVQRRRNVGQVLVYARDDNGTPELFDDTWSEPTVLNSPRPGPNDHFGYAVAVHGNTIVVGAPGEDVGTLDTGAVYVFGNVDSEWQHTQTLAGDGRRGDRFGEALALSEGTLAVGVPGRSISGVFNIGAVQVFDLLDESWVAGTKLVPLTDANVALFGASVAIEGNTIAVGMPLRDGESVADSGAAVTFSRSGQVWTAKTVPSPSGLESLERFGESILLRDGELFVGSPGWDGPGRDVGRVVRYAVLGDAWVEQETLRPETPANHASFGAALAGDAESVWVGSPGEGVATRFVPQDGAFVAGDSVSGPGDFGAAIGTLGSVVLVGAPSADRSGLGSGVAKLFMDVPPPSITVSDASATEDDSELVFSVARTHPYGSPAVTVATEDGTAESATDFAAMGPARIEFSHHGLLEQEVRVTLSSDELVEDDETFALVLSDEVFATLARTSATGTIIDNDTPQFVISEPGNSTVAREGEAPETISVRLTSQPQSPVVLTVSRDSSAPFTVDRNLLEFDSDNWAQPQSISISVENDDIALGQRSGVITIELDQSRSDPLYLGLSPQEVQVQVIDDDTAGILIAESEGVTRVSETGTTDSFNVSLTSKPTADVILQVQPDENDELDVSKGTLTFTTENWAIPQSVEVVGLDDDVVDGTQVITTRVVVPDGSQASEYHEVRSRNLKLRNLDHELDFGFAPSARYPTAFEQDGARHLVKSHLFLGSGVSAENSATSETREANDGARLNGVLQSGALVDAVFEPSAAGFVSLWIDMNHDGDWNDHGELLLTEQLQEAGRAAFPVRLPVSGFSGETYARARFSTRPVLSPYGLAPDGEVEDFVVNLRERPRGIADEFDIGRDPIELNVLANDQVNSPTVLMSVSDVESASVSIQNNRVLFDADNDFTGDVTLTYNASGAVESLTSERNTRRSEYGKHVAIDGDLAAIGVPGFRADRGAVDVYRRSRAGWHFEKRLVSATKERHARFGDAVAISGNTIVVGAPTAESGQVTVFELSGANWVRKATLATDNAAADASFGATLSLDHNSLLIGAPHAVNSAGIKAGVVFQFDRNADGDWVQSNVIESSDAAENDQFGSSMYRDREHLVVGAPKADKRGNASGTVYSFRDNGTEWIERQRLTPSSKGDHFGFAIAGSGNTIAISAPLDDEFSRNHGAVWLFERHSESGRYSKSAVLYADEPIERSRFGEAVAMEGSTLLVSSRLEDAPVIMFQREDNQWTQHRQVARGTSVAISHGMALFGDPTSNAHRDDGGDALFSELNEFTADILLRVR